MRKFPGMRPACCEWARFRLAGLQSRLFSHLQTLRAARIHALGKLGVHLSGASNCQYKAGEKLVVTHTDVDRGASLKKL